jgi:hypothetical protein
LAPLVCAWRSTHGTLQCETATDTNQLIDSLVLESILFANVDGDLVHAEVVDPNPFTCRRHQQVFA